MSSISDIVIDPAGPTPDRMEQHHRQQLSAMADGALAPDQARFLLRRLQHDHELAARWERWQVYGDAMRGHAHALLPAGFAERVARAVQDAPAVEAAPASAPAIGLRRRQALGWAGGGALAASLALAAVLGLRPGAGDDAGPAALPVAEAPTPAPVVETPAPAPAQTLAGDGALAAGAAAAMAAVAVAPAAAARERTPSRAPAQGSGQRVAAAQPARAREAAAVVPASVAEVESPQLAAQAPAPAAVSDPFTAPASPRPWPRAVLPGANQGAFNASYGGPVFAPYPALRTVPVEASGNDAP